MFGRRDDDDAIQTVGAILRALGAADDDADEKKRLEAWAQHVVLQTPSPSTGLRPAQGRRDWPGVRSITSEILEQRAARSDKAVGDLRDTVSAVTRTLVRALAEDRAEDQKARDELVRLKEAAEARPPEEVKRCALQAVAALGALLETRERRHAARVQALQDETARLGARLEDTRRQSVEDVLTGLVNRRGFDSDVVRAVESGEPCCVVIIDLDHFKRVNDTFGHAAGDAVLKAVARSLTLSFPRRGDTVARFGGEELAVLVRGTGLRDGLRLAERALEAVRNLEVVAGDRHLFVTASAGVAEAGRGDDAAAVVERADRCLYAAKRAGRDRATADPTVPAPTNGAPPAQRTSSQGVPRATSPHGFSSR